MVLRWIAPLGLGRRVLCQHTVTNARHMRPLLSLRLAPMARQVRIHTSRNFEVANSTDWAFDQLTRDNLEPKESKISCTVLDSVGKVVAVSKQYDRKQFLAENGLHPRDLRSLDSPKPRLIPSILVRPDCLLVNMVDLRALIKCDKVLIFDSVDNAVSQKLSLLVYDLESKLNRHSKSELDTGFSATQSYEMKALESILVHAVASLDLELKGHQSVLNSILEDLEEHVDRDLLRELLVKNKAMSGFYQKCLLVRNVISDLLDTDEDLVGLYLTERQTGKVRNSTDHAEAELLLESYYKQLDELVQQAEQVLSNVRSTEEILNIILDSKRNSLMLLELKIMILTLGCTVGMFFAALYGMNLKNFIEESEFGFWGVSGGIIVVSFLITLFNFRKLAFIQRINLLADGGPRRRLREKRRRFSLWNKYIKKHGYDEDPSNRAVMWKWLVEKRDS